MTVLRRAGDAASSLKKVVCGMEEKAPITMAAPTHNDPDTQAEPALKSLVAGSSPQRRASRDNGESAALDEREAAGAPTDRGPADC